MSTVPLTTDSTGLEERIEYQEINPDKLASELGISGNHTIPKISEKYQQTYIVIRQICSDLVPGMLGLNLSGIGEFLLANEAHILGIFDKYPDMWRFPIYIRKNFKDFHPILGSTEGLSCFFYCIYFYLVIATFNRLEGLSRTFSQRGALTKLFRSLDSDIAQEQMNEIHSVWGRMYLETVKMILGERRYENLGNRILKTNSTRILAKPEEVKAAMEKFWRRNDLPFERFWVSNPVSEKDPSVDGGAINFLLCQSESYLYRELLQSSIYKTKDHLASWGIWITKYFSLLIDPKSETNKAFRVACRISGTLFESGGLSPEAKKRVPKKLRDCLEVALRRHIPHLKRINGSNSERVRDDTATGATRILQAGFVHDRGELPKIAGAQFDRETGWLSFDPEAPTDVKAVEIRIVKKGKVIGMGTRILEGEDRKGFSLYGGRFTPGMNGDSPQLGKGIINFRPQEDYCIGIVPLSGQIRGTEYRTATFRLLRPQKEVPSVTPPPYKDTNSGENNPPNSSTDLPPIERVSGAVREIIAVTEPEVDPLAQEKEYLSMAIELFFGQNDDKILGAIDEGLVTSENGAVCFTIPPQSLEREGFVRTHLSKEEVRIVTSFDFSSKKLTKTDLADHEARLAGLINLVIKNRIISKQAEDLDQIGLVVGTSNIEELLRGEDRILLPMAKMQGYLDKLSDTVKEHDYRLWSVPDANGNVRSITLSHHHAPAWQVTLHLLPKVQITTNGDGIGGTDDPRVERIRHSLLYLVRSCQYDAVGELISDTIRSEGSSGVQDLRTVWGKKMEAGGTATIVLSGPNGNTVTIRGIKKENLATTITKEKRRRGVCTTIGILHREATYRFPGEGSIAMPSSQRIGKTYESFFDGEEAEDRRQILWERVLATFFSVNSHNHHHEGFNQGTGVYEVLIDLCQQKFKKPRPNSEEDINGDFIEEFIHTLSEKEIPISYQRPFVDTCDWIGLSA